jgi:hypothetical protein
MEKFLSTTGIDNYQQTTDNPHTQSATNTQPHPTAGLGCPRTKQKNFGWNRNKQKQDLFRLCFGLFRETKNKIFWFVSVCFDVSNLYGNNRNKQNFFITKRNNPKFSEKYPNMLSFKLFGLVFCLFRFNRNIETLCFGIEAKQPKQTVSKQTEKKRKNRKNPKCSL